MKKIILLCALMSIGCATGNYNLPPAKCSYVYHKEKQCNSDVMEKVYGMKKDDKNAWSCEKSKPHYTEVQEACKY